MTSLTTAKKTNNDKVFEGMDEDKELDAEDRKILTEFETVN